MSISVVSGGTCTVGGKCRSQVVVVVEGRVVALVRDLVGADVRVIVFVGAGVGSNLNVGASVGCTCFLKKEECRSFSS